jgi:integrase
MKMPNGFGSVYKVKNRKLRKPWMARITEGFREENGKVVQKKRCLGYYETKADAMNALTEYNKNRYNISYRELTFEDCWEMWRNSKDTKNISESTLKGYDFTYKRIPESIKLAKMSDIKLNDYQQFFNEMDRSYNTKRKTKSALVLLYEHLIKNEFTVVNIASRIELGKSGRPDKVLVFTDEEIQSLWDEYEASGNEWITTVLILIYSGVRIGELLSLKVEDIHLEDQYFDVIKSKTEAGVRSVPIHDCLIPFFKHWMAYEHEYLITTNKNIKTNTYKRTKVSYDNYRDSYWDQIVDKLNLNPILTPHATRKTCISLLTRAEVIPTKIKLIVGHAGALTLTEKVYTHIDIKELVKAINKIEIKPE